MTNSIQHVATTTSGLVIQSNTSGYAQGDVLHAEVVGRTEAYTSVKLNQEIIDIPKSVNIQEAVGEKAEFIIEKIDKESISLKYQPRGVSEDKTGNRLPKMQTATIENSFESSIKDHIKSINVEDEGKLTQLAQVLKEHIASIVEMVTDEDVKAIIKDNYNVEKITIDMFKALVDQNKIALKMADEATLQASVDEKVRQFSDSFNQKFGDVSTLRVIIEALKAEQLPINMKQIEKVQQVIVQYDRIMNLSEDQILNVLRNQKAFNIDQANKASFLPEQSVQVTSDVEKLDTQIKKILEQNNIEPRTETIGIVKKAIASNIPLDENTLLKLRTLIGSSGDGLQSSTDSNGRMAQHVIGEAQKSVANDAEKLHALIKRAAENILHKIPTAQIKLPLKITSRATAPKEVVEQLVKNVNTFKDQQIVSVINNDKVMNIKNLVEAMSDMNSKNQNDATQTITSEGQGARISLDEKLTSISMVIDRLMKDTNNFKLDQSVEMTVDTLNTNAKTMVSETGELQFIKSKICIEELRLKMTYEAASRLYEKGIDVATKPIEDVVEHLKVLELEQYASALKVHQVTETEGNLRQMETTMTAVTRLSYTSTQVKFRVLAGEESFTLEAITREQSMTLVAKEAMSRYDIMGTEVRPDLGDRIERTYDQIGPILKELGLEVSDENTRIVKALAANEMALTVENIESLKAIDLKLSQITDTLRPTIVASMIGDGINPMGMDIDEMLEYMKGYSDAFLNTESEQLAEAILDLKNENTLSEDEKSSLIGIYRMLRTIAGSKGQAASFLVKKQLPLNLKNLFEAAKYMQTTKGKREQIKATIDDDFGLLDRVNYKGDKISEQIKTALKDNHMASTQTNAALLENMSEQQVNLTSKNILEATNHQLKLDQFFSSFSHQKMMALDQEGILKDYEKPLEDLTHELKAIKDGGKVETKEILNRLADLVKMDIQSLKTFEKYGLKSTTAQLLTHFTLKENPHEFSEVLNRMFENMSKEGVDTSSLRGQLNKLSEGNLGQKQLELLEEVKQEINQLRDTGTNKGYSQGEQMQRDFGSSNQLIEYQQRLFQNEDYYQIPVWMDDQWVQLNLYYQNHGSEADSKPEDEMDIYLFFETKNLGQVQSHMHLKERHMQFSIYAEQKEDQALLKNYGEQITEIISSSVFELDGISYDHFEAKSPIDEGLDAPTINAIKYVDSKFVAVG